MTRRPVSAFLLALALSAPGLAHAAMSEDESSESGEASGLTFVRFEPIITTVFDGSRARGLLTVTVALQIPDPNEKKTIEAQRIKYIDAFNATLSEMGRLHVSMNRPLNIPMLTARLEAAAQRVYGKRGMRAFVMNASTRRLGA